MSHFSTYAVNTGASAMGALADGGTLDFYAAPQPADADTAITNQTLLASVALNATAFGSASDGIITANAIADVQALVDGEAAWARLSDPSDPAKAIADGTVGATGSGADIEVERTDWQKDGKISINSLKLKLPKTPS